MFLTPLFLIFILVLAVAYYMFARFFLTDLTRNSSTLFYIPLAILTFLYMGRALEHGIYSYVVTLLLLLITSYFIFILPDVLVFTMLVVVLLASWVTTFIGSKTTSENLALVYLFMLFFTFLRLLRARRG